MLESNLTQGKRNEPSCLGAGVTRPSADRLLETGTGRAKVPSMPVTPKELAGKAMEMPTESRAQLAELLVESLDPAEPASVNRKWAAEAKRRRDEVRSGAVATIPADEVAREVRESLKR